MPLYIKLKKQPKAVMMILRAMCLVLKTDLFIYLFIYTLFYVDIYNKKHKNIVIYTTHYIRIAIQMVFNKQICMLIYVNQNNVEKMNCLKRNFNIKNIHINIKQLRITNHPLIENSSTRKPGKQNLHFTQHILLTSNR